MPLFLSAFLLLCVPIRASISDCHQDFFKSVSQQQIVGVTHIAEGGASSDPSPEYPNNATNLPKLCAVKVKVASSDTTSYNFAVLLPDRWNHRLMTTGNGGFGGGINYPDMGEYAHYGFAAVSTDTGHLSDIEDSSWALNSPEGIIDWSYRALHGSVIVAKQLVQAYYGVESIKKSYYTGCATGGRQGLRNIQLYPDDFDGALIGDAAWKTTHLQSWSTWMPRQNYPPEAMYSISAPLFGAITAQIIKTCDKQDGLEDAIVQDPAHCEIELSSFLCSNSAANQSACVTDAQLPTLRRSFGPYTFNGTYVFPGLPYGNDPSALAGTANGVGFGYFQNFVYNDTSYNFTNYTDADFYAAEALDPGGATAKDLNISRYIERGGKILMYHGYADFLIPAGSSIEYVEHTLSAVDMEKLQLDSALRLFLIPGMSHCVSASFTQQNAPWYIAAASQIAGIAGRLIGLANVTHSVPGFEDAKHDSVMALMKWVEEDVPPDELIATKFVDDVAPKIESQRTICPWPKVAKYIGGTPDRPANWICD